MPVNVAAYRVLIASPSDLVRERQVMREVMHEWNEQHTTEYHVSFQPVMWEFAAIPEMGNRPQAILNRQLGDSDMLVGAFWTRIGTPTGVDISGTVEEINRFREGSKSVLLYFSNRSLPPSKIDHEQYAQVKKFHELCNQEGLTQSFSTIEGLREHLKRHLTGIAKDLKGTDSLIAASKEVVPGESGFVANDIILFEIRQNLSTDELKGGKNAPRTLAVCRTIEIALVVADALIKETGEFMEIWQLATDTEPERLVKTLPF